MNFPSAIFSSTQQGDDPSLISRSSSSSPPQSFDISELAQRAADVVSGQAADKGIDLVLNLKGITSDDEVLTTLHATASGNEGAVKCVLIHALSRTLTIAPPRSTLTVGLKVPGDSADTGNQEHYQTPCFFEMRLRSNDAVGWPSHEMLESCLDDSVLHIAQAQCHWNHLDTDTISTAELSFQGLCISDENASISPIPSSSEANERQRFLPRLALGEEPTAQQLSQFVNIELKGKTIALHALESSVFAQHLTQLLQNCGCDVSLGSVAPTGSTIPSTPTEADEHTLPAARTAIAFSKGRPAFVRYSTGLALAGGGSNSSTNQSVPGDSRSRPATAILDPVTGVPLTLTNEQRGQGGKENEPESSKVVGVERDSSTETIKTTLAPDQLDAYSFVMVDDDIETLQRELLRLRSALPLLRGALGQATPLTQHSARSARDGFPLQRGGKDDVAMKRPSFELTYAIVYFTSLKNFRSIRDVLQPIMESAIQAVGEGLAYTLPEILVVPKPAGSRRILTTLKTAMHKPIVDPFFSPLATSPMSPYLWEAKLGKREGGDQRDLPSLAVTSERLSRASALSPNQCLKRPANFKDRSQNLSWPSVKTILSQSEVETASREANPTSPGPVKSAIEQLRPSMLPVPSSSVRSSQGSNSPVPAETLEYFSETAARMGSCAASGLMIQSPDGRPAALYFDPNLSGSASGRYSQSRRAGSLSGPTSVRTSSSRESEGSGLPVGARRKSEEKHSYRRPSMADALNSKSDTTDDTDGLAPTDQTRRASHESISSFTTRPTNFGAAPVGTLFAPEIGIDDVLSSAKLPFATPIAPQLPSEGNEEPLLSSTSRPKATFPKVAASGLAEEGTATGEGQDVFEQAISSEVAALHAVDGPSQSSLVGKTSAPMPATGGKAAPEKPLQAERQGSSENLGEVEGQVRGVHPSFAAASPTTKPSAQPQSGLLIGAGFATSGRRGGGPRKTQVREKVLPPIKVLIVEDNPINQRILKQFMTKKKIKFETAVNGREAVDKWASGGFHLILMDIQLPVMDGIEATKEIRKQELSANVGQLPATPPINTAGLSSTYSENLVELPAPSTGMLSGPQLTSGASAQAPFRASVIIVALTASVLNSDRVAALAAGCNDFLNKPVSLPWLEKKIIEWGSMQYILLSGAGVFDAERRAQRSLHRGQGAAAAAASSSDVRRGFGSNPDAQARLLASKLHLPAQKRPLALPPPRFASMSGPSSVATNGLKGIDKGSGRITEAGTSQIGGDLDELKEASPSKEDGAENKVEVEREEG